jgi:hypothetical protein
MRYYPIVEIEMVLIQPDNGYVYAGRRLTGLFDVKVFIKEKKPE